MAGGLNLALLPIGHYLDKSGRRAGGFVSAVLLMASFVCFGLSCLIDDGALATVLVSSSYVAMGCFGGMLMLVCMTMSAQPTTDTACGVCIPGTVINATIQMCFDLSSGIAGLLSLAQTALGASAAVIFTVYGLLAGGTVYLFVHHHLPADKRPPAAAARPPDFTQPSMLACYAAISSQMTLCYFYLGTVREQVPWAPGGVRPRV